MKRTYNAPTLEMKEYAQLENVFTWCYRQPNNNPDVCYDQTGLGNDSDKTGKPHGSTSHSSLGPPPANENPIGIGIGISGDDM